MQKAKLSWRWRHSASVRSVRRCHRLSPTARPHERDGKRDASDRDARPCLASSRAFSASRKKKSHRVHSLSKPSNSIIRTSAAMDEASEPSTASRPLRFHVSTGPKTNEVTSTLPYSAAQKQQRPPHPLPPFSHGPSGLVKPYWSAPSWASPRCLWEKGCVGVLPKSLSPHRQLLQKSIRPRAAET